MKYSADYVREISQKIGWILLGNYTSSKKRTLWQCSKGHQLTRSFSYIILKHQCLKCLKENERTIIADKIKLICKQRNGSLISNNVISCKQKLRWKCANGHIWDSNFDNIYNKKTWCPRCSKFIKEEKCRFIFENTFERKFLKTRIPGTRLELDGYCDELKLAFEYNGEQHYKKIKYFGNKLKKIKYRDYNKIEICKNRGIKLVVIPYFQAITDEKLIKYIGKNINKNITVDLNNFNKSFNKIDELKNLAKKNSGKLVTKNYCGQVNKFEWQCYLGHRWLAHVSNIRRGDWCPYCSGRRKTVDDLIKLAKTRNGECLSKKYIGTKTKYQWKCEYDHVWESSYNSVKYGIWCPHCKQGVKCQ